MEPTSEAQLPLECNRSTPESSLLPDVTRKELKDLLVAVLQEFSSRHGNESKQAQSPSSSDGASVQNDESATERQVTSKLEFKCVNEIWDEDDYKYRIVDVTPEAEESDEYTFVVRDRSDWRTKISTSFVDIKSLGLSEVLRNILREVEGLGDSHGKTERNILFHFLPEMRSIHDSVVKKQENPRLAEELGFLVNYIETAYQRINEELESLLGGGRITFELLWALFKPGTIIYTACQLTGLPMCARFTRCERDKFEKQEAYRIEYTYLDSDGDSLWEMSYGLLIERFASSNDISRLAAYPLSYHPDGTTKQICISRGKVFVSMMGFHHVLYRGSMFIDRDKREKEMLIKTSVENRIMIDAKSFRKWKPRHPRSIDQQLLSYERISWFSSSKIRRIKLKKVEVATIRDSDLVRCNPSLLGFDLKRKVWGEFSVEGVQKVDFSPTPFDLVVLPPDNKKILRSLAESRVQGMQNDSKNGKMDFLARGGGIIVLLQGPPGVGKTLTAESLAEHLQRPLYSVSSGDLSTKPEELEEQLSQVLQIANAWQAVLLFDEADVFLQQRDSTQIERNRLLAIFLRSLESYQGIFFMTTNMGTNFDRAILDRIHVRLKYADLDKESRKAIFDHFLVGTGHKIPEEEILSFSELRINGRQIRNIIRVAQSVAMMEKTDITAEHVRMALTANGVVARRPVT